MPVIHRQVEQYLRAGQLSRMAVNAVIEASRIREQAADCRARSRYIRSLTHRLAAYLRAPEAPTPFFPLDHRRELRKP